MLTDHDGQYRIKIARTGEKIPVVDEVHLHSVYDPKKEALSFAEKQKSNFLESKNILILGLGFGYHIDALLNLDEKAKDKKIMVIEPNEVVYQDALKIGAFPFERMTIFGGIKIEELYRNSDFIEFLLEKPAIISHPASFNLYNDYFCHLLSYRAPVSLGETAEVIASVTLKEYLKRWDSGISINDLREKILATRKSSNEIDNLFLALSSFQATNNGGES